MAAALCSLKLQLRHYSHLPLPKTTTSANAAAATSLDINGKTDREGDYDPFCESNTKSKRREILLRLGAAAAGLIPVPLVSNTPLVLADEDATQEFRLYLDDVNKYKIMIPPDWQVGSGEGDGVRSLTAFYPQGSSASNVSLVITGLGADFTRLESFGKVDAFAENLVGGLDRSWQRPPGVTAKLVDSKSANGLYYIEYTLQNPGESCRHLFSVLGISNNGWINRLYTLTGQYIEEEAEKYGPKVEKAVASFRLI
ncbi:OLC1v1016160C2 [Oldenlandia corymbosa var. corymbosa]|uniref:OLC1v1016160C2 n=1 Tax=Oldenlandia corymbosa var. corymbosa TaxID=529605 RepID=A0AAV1E7A2_OLDCO|nr:OLC1v1016160C2 [Oldenlandia corymbosa var. corymbosa]